ncbi:hypothetical protein DL1_08640 [Thioclava dalianensis]|uniref:Uncharacterized protein n=1 Tax=Thioclava dalianensis TaxID=1185766 RepID=A0A074TAW7_9RHOB|nr:hypothetical protein [Thioclava dalianensis]KEP68829.1 hypothetical protein DL1_08640 [Thioclava dalianensis]
MDELKRPAPTKWITARIATLLTHYFAADIPPQVQEAIAADWVAALRGNPAWAIARACQWWISAENTARRKRPLPGDIEERAAIEMGPVRVAEAVLGFGIKSRPEIDHTREPRGGEIPLERRRAQSQELLGSAVSWPEARRESKGEK